MGLDGGLKDFMAGRLSQTRIGQFWNPFENKDLSIKAPVSGKISQIAAPTPMRMLGERLGQRANERGLPQQKNSYQTMMEMLNQLAKLTGE